MDLMSIAQLLGNFGEFVGAIAVVITLAYLAVQVRHSKEALDANTRTAKASLSYQAANNRAEFMNGRLIENPELLKLVVGASDYDPPVLNPDEERRLSIANRMIMELVYADFNLYRDGLLEEDYWQLRLEYTKRRLARPYLADWWARERETPNYSAAFLDERDRHPTSEVAI
jgi:hypothetical protein